MFLFSKEKKFYHYLHSGATGLSDLRRYAEPRHDSTAMATGCDESLSQTSV